MRPVTAKQKIAVLLLALLLPVIAAARVYAAQTIDLGRDDGTISLDMVFYGRGEEYPMSGGEMSLYLVGPAALTDSGYYFDTENGRFAGTEEAKKISAMDSDELSRNNAELARTLTEKASTMKADRTAVISDGKVTFRGLKPGLYLIAMTKADDTGATITPFMMSLPDENGSYDISARPKPEIEPPAPEPPEEPEDDIPKTGQLWWPVPVITALGALLIAAGVTLRRRGSNTL